MSKNHQTYVKKWLKMQNFNFGAIFDPFALILRKSGISALEREFHQLSIAKNRIEKYRSVQKLLKSKAKSIFRLNDHHAAWVHAVHAGPAEYLLLLGDSQKVYLTFAENRISKYSGIGEVFKFKNGRILGNFWPVYTRFIPVFDHLTSSMALNRGHVTSKMNPIL